MTPEESSRLAAYLGEYAEDVVREWMRIIEINGGIITPREVEQQARVTWWGEGAGYDFTLGEMPHGEEFGHYRIKVTVEPVDVPPIGPENDLGIYGIEEESEEPPIWRAAEFRWVLAGDKIRLNGQEAIVTSSSVGEWHSAIESRQMDSGKWWDKISAWKHTEVSVRLEHLGARMLTFAPSLTVEILCDAERSAVLLMQREMNAQVIP